MSISPLALLIIILVFASFGMGPWFSHSREWGYGPFGWLWTLIIVLLVLRVFGIV